MTGMNDRIVVRPVSLILSSRALQAGFVLDREGLHMRPLLPFSKPPVIPWARLQSIGSVTRLSQLH